MYTLNIFGNLFCTLWGIHVHNISFLVPGGSSPSDGTKTVKDWTHYDYRTVDLLFILTFHTNHSHNFSSSSIVEQSGSFTHTHTHTHTHTLSPSIAFWHIPANSARFSYATEGALFISAQLSTDVVSTL